MSEKNRKITIKDRIRLIDFMRSKTEEWKETQPLLIEAAEQAGKALGLEIAPSTIADMRKALGIYWPLKKTTSGTIAGARAKSSYVRRIEVLEHAVRKLYGLLGEKIPANLSLDPTDVLNNQGALFEGEGNG